MDFTVTQKLDQVNSSLSANTTNQNQPNQNSNLISAFEQSGIQNTLINTQLKSEQLTHIPDLKKIPASTRKIKALNDFLGQDRARASVEAGIALPYSGYNIFAVGTAGLGKRTMIRRLLQQHAKTMQTPNDWVYVNNFQQSRQPIALKLPSGQAGKFQTLLHQTWQTILKQLERKFTAETYHNRIELIRQQTGDEQHQALIELTKEGEDLDLKLVTKNDEHCFVPVHIKDNKIQEMTQDDIHALNAKERSEISSNMRYMDKKLERLGLHLGDLEDDARDQVQLLNREIAKQVVLPRVELLYLLY